MHNLPCYLRRVFGRIRNMNLRKAEEKDKKAIFEIINLSHLSHFEMSDFIWGKLDFIAKQIKNGEYFVAENGGEIIGLISLRKRKIKEWPFWEKQIMYIETLVVLERYRLRGIGTQLIELAERFTKEGGLDTLRACSFCEYNADNFYLKLGFSLLKGSGVYGNHKFKRFQIKIK